MANSKRKLTRRELGQSAIAAAGAVVASVPGHGKATMALQRRPLGKTGLEVCVLGIGCAPLGDAEVSPKEARRVIDAAADAGINYLDTAPNYRMSERKMGPLLKGRRDKFILVSKVEMTSKQDAIWLVKESLYKLQTDYLDIVHLHNVGRTDRFPSLDVLIGDEGALGGLRQLKK